MKLAIITLTAPGEELAQIIKNKLADDPTVIVVDLYHKRVKNTLNNIFMEYECILGIMATGIMVRSICHLIGDKTKDPAVVVMDEKSNHVISLLSGHLGGGNDYAHKFARLTGADPVITTASDVNGKIGVDSLARKYYLEITQPANILEINQAVIEGKKVKLTVPSNYEFLGDDERVKESYQVTTSKNDITACYDDYEVNLSPRKLVFGVGTRKGVSFSSVLGAISAACFTLNIPVKRIDCLSTAEPKKEEAGILKAADYLKVPLEIVGLSELKSFKHPDITESSFVKKTFGVPGVCEPAALYVAGEYSCLIFKKTVFNNVTVAVAVSCCLTK